MANISSEGGGGNLGSWWWDGARAVVTRLGGSVYIFYGELRPSFGGVPRGWVVLIRGGLLGSCHPGASRVEKAYIVTVVVSIGG